MTEESRMALALREALNLPPQLDLETLARDLRLSILEVNSESFDGALLRSRTGPSGRILVRQDMRETGRKRFTIAHEIGHFVLHRQQRVSCSSAEIANWKDDQTDPERQADGFASELLLPSAEVKKQIGGQWPGFQVVQQIAAYFDVSLTAAARRYCDVAPQSCAVVWTVESKIRWMHRSPSFVHWVKVGQEAGEGSFAARALAGQPVPDDMQEVAAGEWVSSYWLRDDAVIWEQAVAMPNYKGCLSLLWVRREIENRPTEQDELLRELDPEDFTMRRKRWPR